ncbi:response regulator, partial [Alistipes onderdonkii]|nr:response regulator [Alistipes onderdonkii]
GEEGLFFAQQNVYDLVVLDIMLPALDGYGVLERLRADGMDTPVLMLTAKNARDDRVRGLQLGADDYLAK